VTGAAYPSGALHRRSAHLPGSAAGRPNAHANAVAWPMARRQSNITIWCSACGGSRWPL